MGPLWNFPKIADVSRIGLGALDLEVIVSRMTILILVGEGFHMSPLLWHVTKDYEEKEKTKKISCYLVF